MIDLILWLLQIGIIFISFCNLILLSSENYSDLLNQNYFTNFALIFDNLRIHASTVLKPLV